MPRKTDDISQLVEEMVRLSGRSEEAALQWLGYLPDPTEPTILDVLQRYQASKEWRKLDNASKRSYALVLGQLEVKVRASDEGMKVSKLPESVVEFVCSAYYSKDPNKTQVENQHKSRRDGYRPNRMASDKPVVMPATFNRRLATLRSVFVKWYPNQEDAHAIPPALLAQAAQSIGLAPRAFTKVEVRRYWDDVCSRPRNRLRNMCLVGAFLALGLRAMEAVALKVGCVDWERRILFLWTYKYQQGSSEPQKVHIPRWYADLLQQYLQARFGDQEWDLDAPLFLDEQGKAFTTSGVQRFVREGLQRVGLWRPGRATHALRHTFAHLMYHACGKDVRQVSKALRHRRLHTTDVYLQALESELTDAAEVLGQMIEEFLADDLTQEEETVLATLVDEDAHDD